MGGGSEGPLVTVVFYRWVEGWACAGWVVRGEVSFATHSGLADTGSLNICTLHETGAAYPAAIMASAMSSGVTLTFAAMCSPFIMDGVSAGWVGNGEWLVTGLLVLGFGLGQLWGVRVCLGLEEFVGLLSVHFRVCTIPYCLDRSVHACGQALCNDLMDILDCLEVVV